MPPRTNTICMKRMAWLVIIPMMVLCGLGLESCNSALATKPSLVREKLGQSESAKSLAEAFWTSGAHPTSMEVTVWGQVAPKPMAKEAMRRRAAALLSGLGSAWSVKETKLTSGHGRDADKLVAKCYHSRGYRLMLSLQSIPVTAKGGSEEGGETFLVASAWLDNPSHRDDLSTLTSALIPLVYRACPSYSVTQSVTGYIKGLLSPSVMNSTARATLRELRARTNDEMSGPSHVSLSGRSPRLWNSVSAGHDRVNINVALRHDITTKRTWLVLASPIIVNEY